MSWKDEISKTNRFDVEAGDNRESMLNYAVNEILTLVSQRNSVKNGTAHEDSALKSSIIAVINDAMRRVNNIPKE